MNQIKEIIDKNNTPQKIINEITKLDTIDIKELYSTINTIENEETKEKIKNKFTEIIKLNKSCHTAMTEEKCREHMQNLAEEVYEINEENEWKFDYLDWEQLINDLMQDAVIIKINKKTYYCVG